MLPFRHTQLLALLLATAKSAPPVYPPGPLSFYDHDPDAGEVGGVFEFIKATSETDITKYETYFGSSPTDRMLPLASLTADGFDKQYNIPLNTPVPSVGGVVATHVSTFSANLDGEGPGVSLEFHDRAVPVEAPVAVTFQDVDDAPGRIGGSATIFRATDESDATSYVLYFGSGPATLLVSAAIISIQTSPAGDLLYEFPTGTSVPVGASHLLAYTANDDGISQTAASVVLFDRAAPVEAATSLSFQDSDLGGGEISGLLTIGRAADESLVDSYAVYLSRGPTGPLDTLLGLQSATGSNLTFLVPADTILAPGVSHLVVLTRNVGVQMATGASLAIVDKAVPSQPAAAISFTDTDLEPREFGGPLRVTKAVDETHITHYSVFFANAYMQTLSLIAVLNKGPAELEHVLPQGTVPPAGTSLLLVLSGNEDGLMATGANIPLVDKALPVHPPQQVQFADTDIDPGQVGGNLVVFRAVDESDITSYTAYFGSLTSSARSVIGAISVSGLPSSDGFVAFTVFPNTAVPAGATHFLAFSRNDDGEDQTGASLAIIDASGTLPTVSVTATGFIDFDFNLGLIGGPLAWTEPTDILGLTSYTVFLSVDAVGSVQFQVGSAPVTSPGAYRTLTVPLATSLSALVGQGEYLIVYANNNHGRGPPAAVQIVDRAVPTDFVVNVAFADTDPAPGSIGGSVEWAPPINPDGPTQITSFAIYLAEDTGGTARVHQGDTPFGTNAFEIPVGTLLMNATRMLVYTKNDVGEALSASSLVIFDRVLPHVSVTRVQFIDQDLTVDEIGGRVEWTEPVDTTWVERYVLYMDSPDLPRSFLGEVSVRSSSFDLPFNTELQNYTLITVIAANGVGEAVENASVDVLDRTVQSCPSDPGHRVRSSRWRVLAGKVEGFWHLTAIRFFEDALCKSQIPTLPSGWPRRPRLAAGTPFSSLPWLPGLEGLFLEAEQPKGPWENGTQLPGVAGSGWASPQPCPETNSSLDASECSVGFNWESSGALGPRGAPHGSGGLVLASRKGVHCVEVEQSTRVGEYAESLSLQWFDEGRGLYRTLLWQRVVAGGLVQMAYQQDLAAQCAR